MKKIVFNSDLSLNRNSNKILLSIILLLGIGYYSSKNLLINESDSITTGIYRKTLFNNFSKGNYVMFLPEDKFQKYIGKISLNKRNGKKIILLKKIAASEGDEIEVNNFILYINGEEKGKLLKLKGLTEISPSYKKILKKDEFFLLGETANSFDSRYFGTVQRKELISQVKLLIKGSDIERTLGWVNSFKKGEKNKNEWKNI